MEDLIFETYNDGNLTIFHYKYLLEMINVFLFIFQDTILWLDVFNLNGDINNDDDDAKLYINVGNLKTLHFFTMRKLVVTMHIG